MPFRKAGFFSLHLLTQRNSTLFTCIGCFEIYVSNFIGKVSVHFDIGICFPQLKKSSHSWNFRKRTIISCDWPCTLSLTCGLWNLMTPGSSVFISSLKNLCNTSPVSLWTCFASEILKKRKFSLLIYYLTHWMPFVCHTSGYVPLDNAGCCWGCRIALSCPCPIIQVCENSDFLFTPVLNEGFLDFCENKRGRRQTKWKNWKNKTLPLPLHCPAETKKLLVGWKYVYVVIRWFVLISFLFESGLVVFQYVPRNERA